MKIPYGLIDKLLAVLIEYLGTAWKSSLFGVGLILSAVGGYLFASLDGNPQTVPSTQLLVAGICAGIAAIMKRKPAPESSGSTTPEAPKPPAKPPMHNGMHSGRPV